ncbi:MAG: hypothetical protein MK108_14640 [Mariniblastus sp.]|nr:hypothetical protein [Mariniblastus sp.]
MKGKEASSWNGIIKQIAAKINSGRHMNYVITLVTFLLLTNLGLSQETELKSSKAKAAVREYERKLEEVDKEIAKQLKDLEKSYQMKAELVRARYLSQLTEAMEEEARKVNLEEANKIKRVIDEAKKAEPQTLNQLMARAANKPARTTKTKKPKARIPKTAAEFQGHHYAIYTTKMTPRDAQIFAHSIGGHLARIESAEEDAFAYELIKTVNKNYGGNAPYVWIDGSDETNEGQWIFSDGKPLAYTNWYGNQPNQGDSLQNYIMINHGRSDGKGRWDDAASEKLCFLIEWDK